MKDHIELCSSLHRLLDDRYVGVHIEHFYNDYIKLHNCDLQNSNLLSDLTQLFDTMQHKFIEIDNETLAIHYNLQEN